MPFPTCHSRVCVDEEKALYCCAHLNVHVDDDLVFPTLCQMCTKRLEPEPIEKRFVTSKKMGMLKFAQSLRQVAIVIPCHNYGDFLGEAIESALSQSVKPAEIVVVDDGSTDNSGSIARSYAKQGVKLITISSLNVHAARRVGFEATKSPVLCFLDADDCLPPNYLECGLQEFWTHPEAGIVHSDLQCFGTSDRCINFPPEIDKVTATARNQIHAGSLVRRDALLLAARLTRLFPPKSPASPATGGCGSVSSTTVGRPFVSPWRIATDDMLDQHSI